MYLSKCVGAHECGRAPLLTQLLELETRRFKPADYGDGLLRGRLEQVGICPIISRDDYDVIQSEGWPFVLILGFLLHAEDLVLSVGHIDSC